MTYKITHKNSTVTGTPPVAGDIDVGEIAINAADAELYTKDTAGNIRKFQNTTTGTAAGVRFTQSGTGAVQRTVESKLQDVVSVKDYGAVGDGVTNDRAAINNAFSALIANGGGTLYFPKGTYFVSNYIGNTTSTSTEISLSVIGDAGTIINCNPTSYANYALYLGFTNAKSITVENLEIDCNDKVATGIRVSGTDSVEIASVRNCIVRDCYGVNDAGVTANVQGIALISSSWGYAAEISNCLVENVRRAKQSLACQAIVITGFASSTVSGNYINNVRHDGTNRVDADGVVVFSYQASSDYRRSAATISGNIIRNCEGRFVKLQTEGSALVVGNQIEVSDSINLIDNFKGVDSQVADATIRDNKFYFGNSWTGGASASLVTLQCPASANLTENHQAFFQRFENNDAYATTTGSKYLPYTILPTALASGVASTVYMSIKDNRIGSTGDLSNVAFGAMFASSFIYLNNYPTVANTAGKWALTVSGNHVNTYYFLRMPISPQADYAGKWYWYIYDNVMYGASTGNLNLAATDSYTSTMMVRDNNSDISSGFGYLITPFDFSKVLDGFDTYVANQTITNAPPSSTYRRYYKKGAHWGVQSGTSFYISANGTTWTQIT